MQSSVGKCRLDLEDFETSRDAGIYVGGVGMVGVGFKW